QTVQADEKDQFGRAVFSERLHSLPIIQFWQRAVVKERGSNIVGDRFIMRQVAGPLAGNDGGKLVVRKSAALGGNDVSVEFVGGVKCCAGEQDRHLPHRAWQRRRD